MRALLLSLLFVFALFQTAVQAEERPLIHVSAEGSVKTKPDMALINIDIQAAELEAEKARSKTDQQVKKLLKLLKDFELHEGSLDSSQTSIHAEYDYNEKPRQLTGYRASRQISFGLTNLTQLEALVNAVSKIELASLAHIQFSVKDPRYWEDAALSQAIESARNKAELIARELEVQLAGIYRVSHQTQRQSAPVYARAMMMEMDKSAGSSYEQKELEVNTFVEISFNFK
jgi:uncharacterized protein YggE